MEELKKYLRPLIYTDFREAGRDVIARHWRVSIDIPMFVDFVKDDFDCYSDEEIVVAVQEVADAIVEQYS